MCISVEQGFAAKRRRASLELASKNEKASPEHFVASCKQDELLEACLRYDWDQVKHLCRMFSCALSNHRNLVRQQLVQQDRWGNTALHAACHYNPPFRVLKQILLLAKATDVYNRLCTLPNGNGAIPLVVCCTTGGASLPCLLTLLQEVKSKEQLCDKEGNSAIDGLLKRYDMLRKVPKFAKHMKPLKEINSLGNEQHETSLLQSSSARHSQQLLNEMDEVASGGFDMCWAKIELILKAAWVMECGSLDTWTSPLHGAAKIASQIPPELSELLIRCNADMVSTPITQGGSLPLHLAIAQRADCCQQGEKASTFKFVQQLILADPSTASRVDSKTGKLPLIQAIEAGFTWNCGSDDGVLKQLWTAYPEALEEQDPQSGLYPATLAATIQSGASNEQSNNIFSMLRLNPSIVAGG